MKAVLGALKEGSLLTLELLDLVFGSYQRSYKAAHRALYGGFDYESLKKKSRRDIEREEQQVFYTLLNKLKREEFIVKKQSKFGSLWNVTKIGLKKLNLLQSQASKQPRYSVEPEKTLKIIAFDIPETEKKKRGWLREAMRFLGFSMLQRSVWIGKNKIPEDFLLDLKDGGLVKYVHILEVGARGTVKEL